MQVSIKRIPRMEEILRGGFPLAGKNGQAMKGLPQDRRSRLTDEYQNVKKG